MSVEALMTATKEWLKTNLLDDNGEQLSDLECDMTAKGQPVPATGEEFIGIWESGWDANVTGDFDLGEMFGINLTVTRRTGQYPVDKIGSELLYKWSGLLAPRLRQLIKQVHRNFALIAAANVIIASDGSDTNGFIIGTGLFFLGAGQAEIKGPDLFYADKEKDGSGPCGVCRTLKFGKAERQQLIGDIT